MMIERFHTNSTGPDEAALRAAFIQCGALLQRRGSTAMALAVPGKNNLDGVVRNVFGDDVIRVLDRDNRLDLKGITIQLLTERIKVRKLEGPVVAAYVSPAKLDKVVSCSGVTDIVFVPWTQDELEAYMAMYPTSQEVSIKDAQASTTADDSSLESN